MEIGKDTGLINVLILEWVGNPPRDKIQKDEILQVLLWKKSLQGEPQLH